MLYRCLDGLKPRFKSHDDSIPANWSLWSTKNGGAPTLIGSYTDGYSALRSGYLVGYDIPDFHRRRKAGELLCKTPFDRYECSGSIALSYDLTQYVAPNTFHYYHTGTYGKSNWYRTADDLKAIAPQLDLRLVQDAAAKIMSESHDTLTFLAELGSTREMFVNLLKRLLRLDIPKNLVSMSNAWLEGRYGWRTFVYDLEDLNKALSRLKEEQKSRYNKSKRFVYQDLWSDVIPFSDQAINGYFVDTNTVTVSTRGSVTADIDIPTFSFNPVVTAWELVPYSFVLDWFWNVGRALSALTFITLNTKYVASIGYSIDYERERNLQVSSWKTGWSGTYAVQSKYTGQLKYRIPCHVPYTPYLNVRLSDYKILDLLAMLVQRK